MVNSANVRSAAGLMITVVIVSFLATCRTIGVACSKGRNTAADAGVIITALSVVSGSGNATVVGSGKPADSTGSSGGSADSAKEYPGTTAVEAGGPAACDSSLAPDVVVIPSDTCLDIVVPKSAWIRPHRIDITPRTHDFPYTWCDTIYDTVVSVERSQAGPNTVAEICASFVNEINNHNWLSMRVTAEDSGGFYVVRSDSNYKALKVRTDPYQKPDTITANDMYMAIHPSLIYDPVGVTDSLWQYVLGFTPYTSAGYENPCVRVSHDNVTWNLPISGDDTCPDPLITPAACTSWTHYSSCCSTYAFDSGCVASHLSDGHLTRYTNGYFYFFFRATFYYTALCGNATESAVYVLKSPDLVTWTGPRLVAGPDSTRDFISMSASPYRGDSLSIWAVSQVNGRCDSTNRLLLYRTPHPDSTWTFIDTCRIKPLYPHVLTPEDTAWAHRRCVWHGEVKRWGGIYYILMTSGCGKSDMYLGVSTDDGLTFDLRRGPLMADYRDGRNRYHTVYKASSYISCEGGLVVLGIYYSHYYMDRSVTWWSTSFTKTLLNDNQNATPH